jgi:predicted phosphodiesterase
MHRTALIADIHGNSPALRAVLDDIRREECQHLFMLGDIVNGLDPAGCIELVRAWPGVEGIRGNAEQYLLAPDIDQFPLRNQGFFADLMVLIGWWRSQLSPDQLAWLAGLGETIRWGTSCLAHDSPLDRFFPERRYRPDLDKKYQELFFHSRGIDPDLSVGATPQLLEWMEAEGVSEVFCGHTHVQFCSARGRLRICNVGSVGMPLDGDPRAGWVLVEDFPSGERRITLQRLAYDIDASLALVDATPDYPTFAQLGVQQAYRKMLMTGNHWKTFL